MANRHTVVPIVVDQLAKMAHDIPTVHLPSAEETAQLLVTHIICLHGLPEHITTDRGPQFMSRFCLWPALTHPMPVAHKLTASPSEGLGH